MIGKRRDQQGFTLIELMTVLVVVLILIVLLLQVTTSFRARADKATCIANLKNLYIGASAYLQDKGHWPQIPPRLSRNNPTEYAERWIGALEPYGFTQKNWICPTQHTNMKSPDMTKKENRRVDYNATPFDSRPNTPRLWSRQPWFVEHASVHDGGPLLIMTSGQVMTLQEAVGVRRK